MYHEKKSTYSNKFRFSFRPADKMQRSLIHKWLSQNHIKEWLHGEGLKNTLEDLDKFLKGQSIFQHWIGYDQDRNKPFAYLLTSKISKDPSNKDDLAHWCQEEGNAITLDLFICDLEYLGKGLSVPMIQEFLISQSSHVTEVFIDPEASNTRAIHVYEKAGFKIIGEFIAQWHPMLHYRMRLSIKDLLQRIH